MLVTVGLTLAHHIKSILDIVKNDQTVTIISEIMNFILLHNEFMRAWDCHFQSLMATIESMIQWLCVAMNPIEIGNKTNRLAKPFHFIWSVSPISKPTLDRIQWTFRYWLLFLGTILSGKINKNKSKENESRNAVPKVSVGGHIKATKQIALFLRDCRFVWKRLFSVGYAFQRFDSVGRKQWLIGIARACGLQHVLRFRKSEL